MSAVAEFYQREESELFDQDGHWNYDNPNIPSNWNPEQIEHLDRSEFMVHFQQCASKLPKKIRTVFILREVDGLSTPEICEAVGISQQNLWTILHRARMALRQCLEKQFFAA